MIMVEISVPALDKEYDFQLDDYAPVSMLTEEIAEMVCHREQSSLVGQEKDMVLCHFESRRILPEERNLHSLGVKTGDKLLLL